MAKRFSELGIKQQDSRKVFNCQQVSITDILNSEIEVIDFLPNVKTQHGEGRYLVHFREAAGGTEGKFFTNSQALKSCLDQVREEDFPLFDRYPCHEMRQRQDIPVHITGKAISSPLPRFLSVLGWLHHFKKKTRLRAISDKITIGTKQGDKQ